MRPCTGNLGWGSSVESRKCTSRPISIWFFLFVNFRVSERSSLLQLLLSSSSPSRVWFFSLLDCIKYACLSYWGERQRDTEDAAFVVGFVFVFLWGGWEGAGVIVRQSGGRGAGARRPWGDGVWTMKKGCGVMGVGAAGSMAGIGKAGDVAAARLPVFSSATSRVLPGDSNSSCVHSAIHHSRKLGFFLCVISLHS
jgi:hypothetical protein